MYLECQAGKARANLYVQLGQLRPLPPQQQRREHRDQPQPGPCRLHRLERRVKERAAAAAKAVLQSASAADVLPVPPTKVDAAVQADVTVLPITVEAAVQATSAVPITAEASVQFGLAPPYPASP